MVNLCSRDLPLLLPLLLLLSRAGVGIFWTSFDDVYFLLHASWYVVSLVASLQFLSSVRFLSFRAGTMRSLFSLFVERGHPRERRGDGSDLSVPKTAIESGLPRQTCESGESASEEGRRSKRPAAFSLVWKRKQSLSVAKQAQ